VGTYAIKVAAGKQGMKGLELTSLGQAYNPTGQFLPGGEAEFAKLAAAIKKLVTEQKLRGKSVHTCLPESMAYTSVISMPFLSDAELASSIHWEAEQHIPVPLKEVNLEYDVLYKPKKDEVGEKMKVLLVAARKDAIDKVVTLFHTAGVEVVGLETTLLSTYRALGKALHTESAVLVCHIGAMSTDVLVVEQGNIVLTYSIQTGGLALTRAIEKRLGLPASQAEEYKRAYGLDPNQLEGKVRSVLNGVMGVLLGEVRKAMQFYQTSNMMTPIRTMLLTGGSAYLPGMVGYLAEAFSFEVLVANPLGGLKVKDGLKVPEDVVAYTPAVGMLMQEE